MGYYTVFYIYKAIATLYPIIRLFIHYTFPLCMQQLQLQAGKNVPGCNAE